MSYSMYVQFDDPPIKGTSAGGPAGSIEILSWEHGFGQPQSPTRRKPGSAEQTVHENLTFAKYLDAATNELLQACWSGKQFGTVTLSCYRVDMDTGKPVMYLRVVMKHVVISNYIVSGDPGAVPVEHVSLEYGVVQYEYMEQRPMSASEPTPAPLVQSLKNPAVE